MTGSIINEASETNDSYSIQTYAEWLADRKRAKAEQPAPNDSSKPPSNSKSSKTNGAAGTLNGYCQRTNQAVPLPEIEATENGLYLAKFTLDGRLVVASQAAASKKEAKRLLYEQALRDLEIPFKASNAVEDESEEPLIKSGGAAEGERASSTDNWIMKLNNATQYLGISAPHYTDLPNGNTAIPSFKMSLTLAEPLNQSFEPSHCSRSKQAAKAAVAKTAVLWLRKRKYLPDDDIEEISKRRRTIEDEDTSPGPPTHSKSLHKNQSIASSTNYPEQAHSLTLELGLPPIHYNYTQKVGIPNSPYWTVTAHLQSIYVPNARDGRPTPVGSAIASVQCIYGKENARRECAREVVVWLEKEKEKRLSGLRGLSG